MGNAAERHTLLLPLIPGCQSDLQLPGSHLRILEEHLVEVSHPVEENRVRILALDPEILFDHGGAHGHLMILEVSRKSTPN